MNAKPRTAKPTAAGLKVLQFVADKGGEVNSYAGQKGFNVGAAWDKVIRDGLLELLPDCAGCAQSEPAPCVRPIPTRNGTVCYLRVRLTDAGRAVLA